MLKKMKKIEKNRTKPGNPYYLVLFENRTKRGLPVIEIKIFGLRLDSRKWDVEVSGLKIHNFLPWDCSSKSNLIKFAKGFLSLLSNFQTLFSINQLLCAFFGLQRVFLASNMFNLIEF